MDDGDHFGYRVGDSVASDDPSEYLGAEADECARRGRRCEARYPWEKDQAAAPVDSGESFHQAVDSFRNEYCKHATRECIRVKREVACCVQTHYDECVNVCVYNEFTTFR